MAKRPEPRQPNYCLDRQLGRYSIYKQGNSRTMTVSKHVNLQTGSRVAAIQGYLSGTPLYLRLVEQSATTPLSMAGAPPAVEDGVIDEQWCSVVKIRAQTNGTRTVTIPTDTDADLYGAQTTPMVLTGQSDDVTFLKIIPEQIWDDGEHRSVLLSERPQSDPSQYKQV